MFQFPFNLKPKTTSLKSLSPSPARSSTPKRKVLVPKPLMLIHPKWLAPSAELKPVGEKMDGKTSVAAELPFLENQEWPLDRINHPTTVLGGTVMTMVSPGTRQPPPYGLFCIVASGQTLTSPRSKAVES